MKILIISHEYPPIGGGGANACMFLANEFSRMGHHVTILTAKHMFPSSNLSPSMNIRIIRVRCLRKNIFSCTFGEMLTFLISAWIYARSFMKNEIFDICLVFFGLPSGPLAYYLKRKYNLPYVIRSGGGDIPGTQKRFSFLYKLLSPTLKKIWGNASAIITNSTGLQYRAKIFEHRYPISVIENGVDTSFFKPIYNTNKANTTIHILFVSRLLERKGLQYIIPMLNPICNIVHQNCSQKIHLTIVGNGPYKSTLERLTEKYNCKDIITFVGQKDKNALLPFYQNADIFILPSLWEGMPNVVLEAMACGLPIIMSPCEGSDELIADNGFISEIENFDSKIIYLCIHADIRIKMGLTSRKIACEKYQWSSIGKRYLELFDSIIN